MNQLEHITDNTEPCQHCGKVHASGMRNVLKNRFVCEDCLKVLLAPIGTKPGEDVTVTYSTGARIQFVSPNK